VRHISGPDREAARYIVNPEPMDMTLVGWPDHVGARDSGLGYGNRCWLVYCSGANIDARLDAIRAVYPEIQVTADRSTAFGWLRQGDRL